MMPFRIILCHFSYQECNKYFCKKIIACFLHRIFVIYGTYFEFDPEPPILKSREHQSSAECYENDSSFLKFLYENSCTSLMLTF